MEDQRENFKFFQHLDCEYFPCHEMKNSETFNCLFCYCPLYALGNECGGNFSYTKSGIKNCINCSFPHQKDNYDAVLEKLLVLMEKLRIKM
ncbi:cysteine-rich small domain-containing protein [Eubacteriaceae bacterium ES2]|nr:cysteine-rich small domain-containing protein [Eubacteriaceae bacterium ES2]